MKLLSTLWIELLNTLWIGLLSTLWIELLSTLWIELLSTSAEIAGLSSTHSPLWIELLSTAAGLAGIPRIQETEGWQQWGQGGVPWNMEDPATETEGGGAVLSSRTGRPGEHPLTSLGRTPQHCYRDSWFSQDPGDKTFFFFF